MCRVDMNADKNLLRDMFQDPVFANKLVEGENEKFTTGSNCYFIVYANLS